MKKIFTLLSVVAIGTFANAQIVINELYGGGGNSGATLKNDFIELINRGTESVTLAGASLQYASNTGTFNQYHTLPSITLAPNQTYLIQESTDAGGTVNLPTPDYVAPQLTNFDGSVNNSIGFSMAAANGKVVLASDNTQVTGPTASNVIDFVGYGTASTFEGTGAAPAASATNSISRTNGVDTNVNSADFTAGAPSPKNSAGVTLGVTDINKSKNLLLANTMVDKTINFIAKKNASVKVYNLEGKLVKSANISSSNTSVDVSTLSKGVYIVTPEVNRETFSQKIIKK